MTFWQTSSQAQKLAQIDGAIECGMTARQTAINLGTTVGAVSGFAFYNGRYFQPAESKRRQPRKTIKADYEDDAFSIFQSPKNTTRILDMRIDDEEEVFA